MVGFQFGIRIKVYGQFGVRTVRVEVWVVVQDFVFPGRVGQILKINLALSEPKSDYRWETYFGILNSQVLRPYKNFLVYVCVCEI